MKRKIAIIADGWRRHITYDAGITSKNMSLI